MQSQAVEVAQEAMEKYTIEKDIAQYIKREVRTARHASIHKQVAVAADISQSVRF